MGSQLRMNHFLGPKESEIDKSDGATGGFPLKTTSEIPASTPLLPNETGNELGTAVAWILAAIFACAVIALLISVFLLNCYNGPKGEPSAGDSNNSTQRTAKNRKIKAKKFENVYIESHTYETLR